VNSVNINYTAGLNKTQLAGSTYNYTLSTPIAFYFTGDISNSSVNHVSLAINNITMNIYYYGSLVSTHNITSSSTGTGIFSGELGTANPYIMDLSSNALVSGFQATFYLGNLNTNAISLPNDNSYFYDITLYIDYEVSASANVSISSGHFISNYFSTTVSPTPSQILIPSSNISSDNSTYNYIPFSFVCSNG